MRLKTALLIGSLVGLAGCHPREIHHDGIFHHDGMFHHHDDHPMVSVAKLNCPDQVGELTRTAQAADGKSCAYSGPQNEDVQLNLTPLDGATPDVRLASLDQTLKAEVPAAAGSGAQGVYVASDKSGDRAHIDLPGFHLDAHGDKADIHMPGISIDADGDDAKVSTGLGGGNSVVNAHKGGAEIRAGGTDANGVDVTYLLASDTPGPNGYRAVGYVAKGPAAGPLVVGVFKAREQGHHDDDGGHGLDRLIDMNVHARDADG